MIDIEIFRARISGLRRGRKHGRTRPHKLVMLLAVIDMLEEGLLADNRIYLDDDLIQRFRYHFEHYRKGDDLCQAGPPFFHLRTSGFWHHKVRPGREAAYARMSTSGGGVGPLVRNIEYAYLDDSLLEMLRDPVCRTEIRDLIDRQLRQEE